MIEIFYTHTVASTNDLAMESTDPWSIYIADVQTKGRGQRGNSWESEEMKNLTFSLSIAPNFLPAQKQFYISKIVSLSIIYLLEDLDITAKIKWPNDIYVGDEKICGILIENIISVQSEISKSVIGIGLNVNQQKFLSDAPNPTSILNISGVENNRNEVLNSFALHMTKLYTQLEEGNFEHIDSQYIKHLYRFDELHTYIDSTGEFMGKIVDVEPQGELLIEDIEGYIRDFLFKEVEYVI